MNMMNFFRKGKHPLNIIDSPSTEGVTCEKIKKKNISRRHSIERSSGLSSFKSRRRRGISPGTKKRMDVALGLADESIITAPAALNENKGAMSIKSAPTHTDILAEIKVPMKVGVSISRRYSYLDQEALSNSPYPSRIRSPDGGAIQHTGQNYFSSNPISKSWKGRSQSEGSNSCLQDKSAGFSTLRSYETSLMVYQRKSDKIKEKVKVPNGEVSIVITDIQGSTMMWEQDSIAMKYALDMHDSIVRKCYTQHNGYEITTEGDSFHLAFQHPLDALSFCLQCQIALYEAKWSEAILALDGAREIQDHKMKGLRIRMGVNDGITTSELHEITQRTHFRGGAVELARAIESSCHGGQVVTSLGTWRKVSGMAERYLGSPQVVDLGSHELQTKSGEIFTSQLVQLVPNRLAFDYFKFRGIQGARETNPTGRTFPALNSIRQLKAAFCNAPYLNSEVVIMFAYTIIDFRDLDDDEVCHYSEATRRKVRHSLENTTPPGYECHEDNGVWMFAFHEVGSAIVFGLNLIQTLDDLLVNVKIGVHPGNFVSMGPHRVTGRADYFGPVVNRAARIASSSGVGQLLFGVPKSELYSFKPPKLENVKVEYLGVKIFKGVTSEISVFECKCA